MICTWYQAERIVCYESIRFTFWFWMKSGNILLPVTTYASGQMFYSLFSTSIRAYITHVFNLFECFMKCWNDAKQYILALMLCVFFRSITRQHDKEKICVMVTDRYVYPAKHILLHLAFGAMLLVLVYTWLYIYQFSSRLLHLVPVKLPRRPWVKLTTTEPLQNKTMHELLDIPWHEIYE